MDASPRLAHPDEASLSSPGVASPAVAHGNAGADSQQAIVLQLPLDRQVLPTVMAAITEASPSPQPAGMRAAAINSPVVSRLAAAEPRDGSGNIRIHSDAGSRRKGKVILPSPLRRERSGVLSPRPTNSPRVIGPSKRWVFSPYPNQREPYVFDGAISGHHLFESEEPKAE